MSDEWDVLWADYAEVASWNPAQAYRRRLVMGALGPAAPPGRILDVGSGQGDLARDLATALPGWELAGLEISATGVEISRRKVPVARFFVADLVAGTGVPPELTGWATHAVCSEVLEHVDDPLAVLATVRPLLRPGAPLVVTVPSGPMSAFDRHIGHRRHFRPHELAALMGRAGFAVDDVRRSGWPFFNLYRMAVIARGEAVVRDARQISATGRATRLAGAAADGLFRANLRASPWGWQLVGVGRVPA